VKHWKGGKGPRGSWGHKIDCKGFNIYTHMYIYIYIYKLKAYFIIVCSTVAKKKLVIEGMNEPSTGQDTSEIELIETFGAPATNVFSALFAEVEIKVIQ
jgi:hypothetical protein